MEENKCCKSGECNDSKMCALCPCHWSAHQRCVARIFCIIIVLLVVFSLGATYGEHKNGFEERGYGQRYMMNRGFNGYGERGLLDKNRTGSVTVQVAPNTDTTPVTPTAPAPTAPQTPVKK